MNRVLLNAAFLVLGILAGEAASAIRHNREAASAQPIPAFRASVEPRVTLRATPAPEVVAEQHIFNL